MIIRQMEKVIFTQIDLEDLSKLIEDSVRRAVAAHTPERSANDQNDLMTVEETAKFLSLTAPTIYSKKSRGELPFMKQGKRVYFSKTQLIHHLKSGNSSPNIDPSEILK